MRSAASSLAFAALCTAAAVIAPAAPAQTPARRASAPPPVVKEYAAPEEFGDILNSVPRMKAFLAKRRAEEAAYQRAVEAAKKAGKTPPPPPARRGHKTGWYEARLHRMEMRAGPDGLIHPEDYDRAADHRDQMPAARISLDGRSTGGALQNDARPFAPAGVAGVGGIAAPVPGGPPVAPPSPVPPVPPPAAPPEEAAWEFIGPRNLAVPYTTYFGPADSATSGRVNGVAFSPTDPNTIYLAAAGGGVWKTTNGGVDWTPLGDGFSFLQTTCVAVHPLQPDVVFVGLGDHHGQDNVGYSRGIMKSTDGGATWTNVGRTQMSGQPVSAIVIDPDNPNIVTAATGRGSVTTYIWRSTDGGTTWTRARIGAADAAGNWSDLEAGVRDSTSGVRLYWAARQSAGIYVSTDRGATWSQVSVPSASIGAGIELAASTVSPNTVYYLNSADRQVYRGVRNTSTGAMTWTNVTGNFPNGVSDSRNLGVNYNWSQSSYDIHLNVARQSVGGTPTDVLYAGLITLASSTSPGSWTDVGQTYRIDVSPRTHSDQHSFAAFPGDPNRMIIGNDGGVYGMTYNPTTGAVTIDGTSWSRTLGVTQFYYADFHPTDPDRMLGGTQDNATPAARGDLFNWINVGGGDGGGVAINPVDPRISYCMSQGYGGPYRNTNGWANGNSYNSISPANSSIAAIRNQWAQDSKPFIGVMAIDPNWPNPMYIGTQYLWRWDELTQSWSGHLGPGGGATGAPTGGQNFGSTIRAIAVAPSDSRIIYVGCSNGNLWMTTNYGATFIRLDNASVPDRTITDISVHPNNPYDIVFTLSGAGGSAGNVFRCANTQAVSLFFQNISGSGGTAVPSITHNSITRDFRDPANTFYVGTDVGMFMTENGGASWANATQPLGLPNVEVSTVRAMPRTGYLMCATYGRGAWRIPLVPDIPGRIPDLRATQTVAKSGSQYTFTVTLRNYGPATAVSPRITASQLRVGNNTYAPTTGLPLTLGNITYGNAVTFQIRYTVPGLAAGTPAQFGITGTYQYTGGKTGTVNAASRVTLP